MEVQKKKKKKEIANPFSLQQAGVQKGTIVEKEPDEKGGMHPKEKCATNYAHNATKRKGKGSPYEYSRHKESELGKRRGGEKIGDQKEKNVSRRAGYSTKKTQLKIKGPKRDIFGGLEKEGRGRTGGLDRKRRRMTNSRERREKESLSAGG